jgi:hypothetical protein
MRSKQQRQTEQKAGSAFSRMEPAVKNLSHTVSALQFFRCALAVAQKDTEVIFPGKTKDILLHTDTKRITLT